MSQTLAGKTIHVDNDGIARVTVSNYAFQNVLGATVETISYYGAKSDRITLTFILDEDENSGGGDAALRAAVKANSDVNLTMDTGSIGNVRILNYHASRLQALNHTNPVYKCQAELVLT